MCALLKYSVDTLASPSSTAPKKSRVREGSVSTNLFDTPFQQHSNYTPSSWTLMMDGAFVASSKGKKCKIYLKSLLFILPKSDTEVN